MTDEERKEFEEFQKWKDEKKKEESLKHGEAITPSDDGLQIKEKIVRQRRIMPILISL